MRIRGAKTTRLAWEWLRSRWVDHAVVLGYHRIAEGADPYRLAVSPAHFAEQLAAVAENAQPVHLDALPRLLDDGRLPRRAVVITFDDGYADVLHAARPLLERFGIPATVFAISGVLGRELWWDRVARLTSTPGLAMRPLQVSAGEHSVRWTGSGEAGSAEALRAALYAALLAADETERECVLDRLEAGVEGEGPPLNRTMTADELRSLAAGDLVRIGAHTVTHPPLSRLDEGRQREEIIGSRTGLETLLRSSITLFSYPHGDAGGGAPAVVRQAGYDCACTSRNAVAWRGSDRFALPRFWVPDWGGARFARWLARWLDG